MGVSTVALLGLGRMGAAMAAGLSGTVPRLVVWNRGAGGLDLLRGELGARPMPEVAETAAEAVDGAELILTMLADGPALEAVLFGPGGVGALRPGTVLVDSSTIGVPAAHRVARRLGEQGVAFVDAPVSGSVATVRAGRLLVMAGGDGPSVRRAAEVLAPVASQVVHVGGHGSGQAMKLSVNAVLHAFNAAVSEALVLCERAGVSTEVGYDVLAGSVVGAPFLEYKRAAFTRPGVHPPAFTVDLMAKDLRLIEEHAAGSQAEVPVTAAVLALADEVRRAGHGSDDMSAVAVHLRRQRP